MIRMTASDARKNWFKLLDAVAAGDVVSIERKGRLVVLRSEDPKSRRKKVPDYRKYLRGGDIENAHRWTWEWNDSGELVSRERPPE